MPGVRTSLDLQLWVRRAGARLTPCLQHAWHKQNYTQTCTCSLHICVCRCTFIYVGICVRMFVCESVFVCLSFFPCLLFVNSYMLHLKELFRHNFSQSSRFYILSIQLKATCTLPFCREPLRPTFGWPEGLIRLLGPFYKQHRFLHGLDEWRELWGS